MRQIVATDTFDASIGASWDNGWADWATAVWASGGYIQASAVSTEIALRWNAGTWARKQWARAIINVLNHTTLGLFGPALLSVGGATDESCYTGFIMARPSGNPGSRYWIAEWSAAFGETILAQTGDGTTPALVAGDSVTLESDGAGQLTLYTCEANVSSGVETQRLTINDTTLTTGNPAIYVYCQTTVDDTMTQWDAGNLLSSWPAVCPHRPHQYHRAHNQR